MGRIKERQYFEEGDLINISRIHYVSQGIEKIILIDPAGEKIGQTIYKYHGKQLESIRSKGPGESFQHDFFYTKHGQLSYSTFNQKYFWGDSFTTIYEYDTLERIKKIKYDTGIDDNIIFTLDTHSKDTLISTDYGSRNEINGIQKTIFNKNNQPLISEGYSITFGLSNAEKDYYKKNFTYSKDGLLLKVESYSKSKSSKKYKKYHEIKITHTYKS